MGWLEFLSNLIDALAWPVVIAVAFLLLLPQLRRLISRLKSASYRGVGVEFGEAVDEVELGADAAGLPPEQEELAVGMTAPGAEQYAQSRQALVTRLAPEIATAPRAAVIEAFLAVERELEALARAADLDPEGKWLPRRVGTAQALANLLAQRGVIEPALASVIGDLQKARNVAAHEHAYEVERDEVVDYVKLAGRVRSALRLARQSLDAAGEGRTSYDLLVYHDLSDSTETTGGAVPKVGDKAYEWFGPFGEDRYVVAVGPGVHEGKVTVVLAHGNRPMTRLQALLDQQADS